MSRKGREEAVIVVYGGSQVDAHDRSQPRFPEASVDAVARRVREQLQQWRPRLVIGSAASGADLLVLEAARAERIATHVVLPFPVPRFLETSVAARGAAWVARFAAFVDPADVEILDDVEDDDVYHRTNEAVLRRAVARADAGEAIVALLIRPSEGGEPSVSDDLAARASARGYPVTDIDPGLGPG